MVDHQIRKAMEDGDIVIYPFIPEHLNTVSYDVRLGPWFVRAKRINLPPQIFNPSSQESINRRWGEPQMATSAYLSGLTAQDMEIHEIHPDQQVILLYPNELILAHTMEFIGGVQRSTGAMNARSTAGRDGFSVCMCAGWGDVGYISPWTMEIRNNTTEFTIVLTVGTRIAQIHFFGVEKPDGLYSDTGHYQLGDDVEVLRETWNPQLMLPHPL